jgi:hypothetical protein
MQKLVLYVNNVRNNCHPDRMKKLLEAKLCPMEVLFGDFSPSIKNPVRTYLRERQPTMNALGL